MVKLVLLGALVALGCWLLGCWLGSLVLLLGCCTAGLLVGFFGFFADLLGFFRVRFLVLCWGCQGCLTAGFHFCCWEEVLFG